MNEEVLSPAQIAVAGLHDWHSWQARFVFDFSRVDSQMRLCSLTESVIYQRRRVVLPKFFSPPARSSSLCQTLTQEE